MIISKLCSDLFSDRRIDACGEYFSLAAVEQLLSDAANIFGRFTAAKDDLTKATAAPAIDVGAMG